jgi:ATPase subunit of ABC transporter with duplicated ATPase domains
LARGQGEYSVWNRQEALRLQRQSAATKKAAERQRRLRETEEGKASAQRLNEDLTGRVGRLESILRRGLDREAAIDLNTLVRRDEFPPLDLGAYRVAAPPPVWSD